LNLHANRAIRERVLAALYNRGITTRPPPPRTPRPATATGAARQRHPEGPERLDDDDDSAAEASVPRIFVRLHHDVRASPRHSAAALKKKMLFHSDLFGVSRGGSAWVLSWRVERNQKKKSIYLYVCVLCAFMACVCDCACISCSAHSLSRLCVCVCVCVFVCVCICVCVLCVRK